MCDEVQGFYYYKPMPADELIIVLENGIIPSIPAK
jgi:EAL domain-containing protein (putative c-di-GMP-specific phosphodiesterase class I)